MCLMTSINKNVQKFPPVTQQNISISNTGEFFSNQKELLKLIQI